MRVIGGEFRSRAIKSLPGLDVRPTPDRLREALFNILTPRVEARSSPIYTPAPVRSGNRGIEPGSRARDFRRAKARGGQSHSRELAIARSRRPRGSAARARHRYDPAPRSRHRIFLIRPMRSKTNTLTALDLLGEKPPPLVIAQHPPRLKLSDRYGALHRTRLVSTATTRLVSTSLAHLWISRPKRVRSAHRIRHGPP